jgi:outer membrane protein assembly factor BamD (BamD/ComL family)
MKDKNHVKGHQVARYTRLFSHMKNIVYVRYILYLT